jgi:hypothetical protein
VVEAAKQALERKNVNYVLPWIQRGQEAEVRDGFSRAVAVRGLNTDARELADMWFFETVVRLHRVGEGAPYNGLKPPGSPVPAAVRMIDAALKTGEFGSLAKHFQTSAHVQLRRRFDLAVSLKSHDPADVSAGRRYVAAYVDLVHFAEELDEGARAGKARLHEHAH